MSEGYLLSARGLHRSFGSGSGLVHALRGVDLDLAAGELLVVRGRSGSGKTTLLNVLGGLDHPDSGWVTLDGARLSEMSERELVQVRRHRVGFVFQNFGLLPILSAAENVGVPLRLVLAPADQREARVGQLLELVGLAGHRNQRPHELSGGQQQRVAIARALANSPDVLIADEPTGQLDSHTGRSVMDLLHRLTREQGVAAVVATHDPLLISMADRVLGLEDGVLTTQREALAAPSS